MTTDKEETIRYQAGLSQQITNTILMIDGVIDASVQLSFPPETTGLPGEMATPQKITAAVYVKHQGVVDDPNTHLENKIKRLVSGSVTGLDINDVTIVSDRSRFTDVAPLKTGEKISPKGKDYVSIWSIVMSKDSAKRFRFLFFFLIGTSIFLALFLGWLIWKVYPVFKKRGGFKELLNPIPIMTNKKTQPPPVG
jgi:type III secretion protein J